MTPTELLEHPWMQRARNIVRRIMPVVSLLIGVAGAVLMDRRDERVGRLVAFMTLGWLLGVAAVMATMMERMRQQEPEQLRSRTGTMARWRRSAAYSFAERTAVQVCLSQALFFPLPHYLRSFAATPAQYVFMALFAVACVVVLVDAIYDRVYERPITFSILMAFSGACALQLALPTLVDLPLQHTLMASALLAVLVGGLPAVVREWRWGFRPTQLLVQWMVLLAATAAAVQAGVVGPAVPMVPLQLVGGGVGDTPSAALLAGNGETLLRNARTPAPVVCATRLQGPQGLQDQLWHVWLHDSVEVARMETRVVFDQEPVAQVVTSLKKLGVEPFGAWRCVVEGAAGQVLGGVDFQLKQAPLLPPTVTRRAPGKKNAPASRNASGKRPVPAATPEPTVALEPAAPEPVATPLPSPQAILPAEEPPAH